MTEAQVLPPPLFVLLHLHVLDYPFDPHISFDDRIFDPKVHSATTRSKLMEDMCFFLVSKIEGRQDLATKILPTYPCLRYSDTINFRTSLSKYINTIRHHAIQQYDHMAGPSLSWWRDAVVRKSILEQCTGERFERILLALSTYALFKNSNLSSGHPSSVDSQLYAACLRTSLATYEEWQKLTVSTQRRAESIELLRVQISKPVLSYSPYCDFSTDRLLALLHSRLDDFSRSQPDCRKVVGLIRDFASLGQPSTPVNPKATRGKAVEEVSSVSSLDQKPLSIAAAHHPSYIRKIKTPLIPITLFQRTQHDSVFENPPSLSKLVTGGLTMGISRDESLQNALDRERKFGEAIEVTARDCTDLTLNTSLTLDLWIGSYYAVDFEIRGSFPSS